MTMGGKNGKLGGLHGPAERRGRELVSNSLRRYDTERANA